MGQKGLRLAILFIGVVIFMAGYMPWANYTAKQYFKDFVLTLEKGPTPDFDKLEAPTASSLQRIEDFVSDISGNIIPDLGRRLTRMLRRLNRRGSFDLSAWDDKTGPFNLGLPNWIVPVLGAVLALLAIGAERRWLVVSWKIFFFAALYMTLHAALYLVDVAGEARIRGGLIVAIVACLALTRASWRLRTDSD